MKKIMLALIFLFSAHLFSQNNELSFGSYPTLNPKGYKVRIKENEHEIYIQIKLIDSISEKISEDRKYRKLWRKRNRHFNTNTSNKKINTSISLDFDQLFEKYAIYRTKSVTLNKKKYSKYYLEFIEILDTPLPILKNEDKSRIVIDGYTVKLIRKTKGETELLSLDSPNKKSHPILFKFMLDTLNTFRNEDKSNFIDKKYTFGL